jgi:hypothetical protein
MYYPLIISKSIHMKKKLKVFILVMLIVFTAGTSMAQEWSKEQSEVWKVVQDTWKGWKAGDATAVAASFHEKYQGWSDDMPLPIGKQAIMEWFSGMKDAMTFNHYSIEPTRILVYKTSAVVDYYYYYNVTWTMGDEKETKDVKGKIVEFYVNDGGKWLLLGDMMIHGEDDDEEDDD